MTKVAFVCLSKLACHADGTVEFHVFVEKRTGRRGATRIKLLAPNPEGRSQGVVHAVKGDYGFIKGMDPDKVTNMSQETG